MLVSPLGTLVPNMIMGEPHIHTNQRRTSNLLCFCSYYPVSRYHCTICICQRVQVPPVFSNFRGIFVRPSAAQHKAPPTCRRLRKTFVQEHALISTHGGKITANACAICKGSFKVCLWFIFVHLVFMHGRFSRYCFWCFFRVGLGFIWDGLRVCLGLAENLLRIGFRLL